MNDHAKILLGSPFWNKKIDRAMQVSDVNKDGLITRKDFKLVVQHYKVLGGVTAKQHHHIKTSLIELCDATGLTDDTKQSWRAEEMLRKRAEPHTNASYYFTDNV